MNKKVEEFDTKRFESLSGLELQLYCAAVKHICNSKPDFFEYFKEHYESFDDDHLQCAIIFLGHYRTIEAYREVVKYLNHPNKSVRFPIVKILTNNEDYENIDKCIITDKSIMAKVKETLEEYRPLLEDIKGSFGELRELQVLIDKEKELLEKNENSN